MKARNLKFDRFLLSILAAGVDTPGGAPLVIARDAPVRVATDLGVDALLVVLVVRVGVAPAW